MRALLSKDSFEISDETINATIVPTLKNVIDDLYHNNKKVIFTMGKGGVGKTSVAAAIALALASKDKKVHLTTTDPAAHLKYVVKETENITMSHIDEEAELKRYQEEILSKARETMSEDDVAYIEEDLRSPCTQEIAVFRAFAEVVDKADNEIVVIDTAPTGHTLLLLDSTQSYHREVKRTQGDIPENVKKLLGVRGIPLSNLMRKEVSMLRLLVCDSSSAMVARKVSAICESSFKEKMLSDSKKTPTGGLSAAKSLTIPIQSVTLRANRETFLQTIMSRVRFYNTT